MNKCLILLLIFVFTFALKAEDEIIQIGEFNCVPKTVEANLVKGEFCVLSSSERTVQVKDRKSFPQRLAPGQRIALFLDSMIDKSILSGNNLILTVSLVSDVSWGKRTPIAILFNNYPIWKAVCTENPQKISAVIPASYINRNGNIIQIRNEGINFVAFDALQLKKEDSWGTVILSPNASDTLDTDECKKNNIFEKRTKQILMQIKSKIRSFAPLGIKFQNKLLKSIPYRIAQYLQNGGKPFNFIKFATNKAFFDPFSGKPRTIPWEPIKRLSALFEGSPKVLPCDLLPVARDGFIQCGSWCAVRNTEDVITILCATYLKEECGKEVKIILPLDWRGNNNDEVDAELKLISGFTGETSETVTKPREEKTERVKIINGVFEYKLKLTRCSIIRLVRNGTKEPPKLKLPQSFKTKKSEPKRLTVFKQHIPDNFIRTIIHYAKGRISVQSRNYAGKTVDATRGTINVRTNIVPVESKSALVEISYPNGKASASEGASMYFGNVPKNFEYFSFWVYPRATNKNKKVTLKFYFNYGIPKKNIEIYQCLLKTEQWQNIVMPLRGKPFPRWGSICILGDPKLPAYKKGEKVSFEFNGFCVFEKPNTFLNCRVIKEKAKSGKLSSLTVLFFGRPSKAGVYRHVFKYPVEFKKMSMLAKLPNGNKPELTYLKDGQILEVKYKFPNEYFPIPDKVMKLLTKKEKYLVNNRAFLCTGVKLKLE